MYEDLHSTSNKGPTPNTDELVGSRDSKKLERRRGGPFDEPSRGYRAIERPYQAMLEHGCMMIMLVVLPS